MKKKFPDGTVRGPYTNRELFELINGQLKENGLLPEILDYASRETEPVQITTYEWDAIGIPNFGGSEGIYLDLYADGIVNRESGRAERKQIRLGTYKTLGEKKEDFLEMCRLLTEFVFALRSFVDSNMSSFTWEGFDLSFINANGKCLYGYSKVKSLDDCRKRLKEAMKRSERIAYGIAIDNTNGETTELRLCKEEQA